MRFVIAIGLLVTSLAVEACALPVFRHALERWSVSDYRLEVPAGPKSDELVQALLANAFGNIRIDRVDDLPRAALYSPNSDTAIWTGSFETESYRQLVDSPARAELVHRILSGHTAVWVVVAPETERKELIARLAPALTQFEKSSRLPAIAPGDLGTGPPLLLKFSILEVDPLDEKEAAFLAMISRAPTLKGPCVVPIFGRGRALGVLQPEKQNAKAIEETCQFLIGSCSCELDVGWDLLISVDWGKELQRVGRATLQSETSKAAQPETVVINPKAISESPESQSAQKYLPLAGLILLALGALALRVGRRTGT